MRTLELLEDNFLYLGCIEPVTRAELMNVFFDIEAILIRVSYGNRAMVVSISDIELDIGEPRNGGSGVVALSIEQCQCPPGYEGLSCERCAPGYLYITQGPLAGRCEACTCNGHSSQCNTTTGICLGCQHNTVGPRCEMCATGYYGDATQGSSTDCRQCACPQAGGVANFSPTCVLANDGNINCTACDWQYTGRYCHQCSDGYYGDPTTGEGKCFPCECDHLGSVSNVCDKVTGRCTCLTGVMGPLCDQCAPLYGLEEGGCVSCYDNNCTGRLLDMLDSIRSPSFNLKVTAVAPWPTLVKLENETLELKNKYDLAKATKPLEVRQLDMQLKDLKKKAKRLEKESKNVKKSASSVKEDSGEVRQDASTLERYINDLSKMVQDTIEYARNQIENFATKPVQEAQQIIDEARRIIAEIEAKDFSGHSDATNQELLLSQDVLRRAQMLLNLNTSGLNTMIDSFLQRINDINSKFVEIIDWSTQANNASESAHLWNLKSLGHGRRVEMKMYSAGVSAEDAKTNLKEAWSLLVDANRFLNIALANYQILEGDYNNLTRQVQYLIEVTDLLANSLPAVQELVYRAGNHSNELLQISKNIDELFGPTRNYAEDALRAANAYSDIVRAVNEADNASKIARAAADEAYKTSYPDSGPSLPDRAESALTRSKNQLKTANRLKGRSQALRDKLNEIIAKMALIQPVLEEGFTQLDHIIGILASFDKDLGTKAIAAAGIANEAEVIALAAKDIATDVSAGIVATTAAFEKGLLDQNAGKVALNEAAEKISSLQDSIRNARVQISEVESAAGEFDRLNVIVTGKFAMLKEQIRQARLVASSIRVTLKSGGTCARSYKPVLTSSFFNTFSVKVKIEGGSHLIFYMKNAESTDFMSLEILDRQAVLTFDLGSGQLRLAHPALMQDDIWYKIEMTRSGQQASLNVNSMESDQENVAEVGWSSGSNTILTFDKNSTFFVSGVPEGLSDSHLKVTTFTGYLNTIVFNENVVGLHNFVTSNSDCDLSREAPKEVVDSDEYSFEGSGYAILQQDMPSSDFGLDIKTYSENALIFFAASDNQEMFMSFELINGKVVYKFNLGTETTNITSNKKVNDGQWHKIYVRRIEPQAVLRVDNEFEIAIYEETNKGLKTDGRLYFGGLNHMYQLSVDVIRTPFRGCMRELNFNSGFLALKNSQDFAGIRVGCVQRASRTVSFQGDGYLELEGINLASDSNITLTFSTFQEDALFLYAVNKQNRKKRNNVDNTESGYSIYLSRGHVEVVVNAGLGERIVRTKKSNGMFNDGLPHVVTVQKTGKKIKLYVDDVAVQKSRKLPGSEDKVVVTSFYIGGAPSEYTTPAPPLSGCVQDVVIRNRPIDFANYSSFSGASIDECVVRASIENSMPADTTDIMSVRPAAFVTSQNQQPLNVQESVFTWPQCHNGTFESITGARQFGLTKNSRLEYKLESRILQKWFDLKLEFRTVSFMSGVLAFMRSNDDTVFFGLYLMNGFVAFQFDNGESKLEVLIDTPVDDGLWHQVTVNRNRRTCTLSVDGKQRRIKAKSWNNYRMRLESPLYIGGIPDSASARLLGEVPTMFNGCIRKFELNYDALDLAAVNDSYHVTNCFTPTEQPPAYHFLGQGFAAYYNTYSIGEHFEIAIKFKTNQSSGTLLYANSDVNKDMLLLQLKNGTMVFTINNGQYDMHVTFTSDTILCDYQWHEVHALKDGMRLELNVDKSNRPVQYIGTGTTNSTDTNSSLFFGGIPSSLAAKSGIAPLPGFTGCMKKDIMLNNGQYIDLYSAYQLDHVILGVCPQG